MKWLASLFRRPLVIAPDAVLAGDDLVVSLRIDETKMNDFKVCSEVSVRAAGSAAWEGP